MGRTSLLFPLSLTTILKIENKDKPFYCHHHYVQLSSLLIKNVAWYQAKIVAKLLRIGKTLSLGFQSILGF